MFSPMIKNSETLKTISFLSLLVQKCPVYLDSQATQIQFLTVAITQSVQPWFSYLAKVCFTCKPHKFYNYCVLKWFLFALLYFILFLSWSHSISYWYIDSGMWAIWALTDTLLQILLEVLKILELRSIMSWCFPKDYSFSFENPKFCNFFSFDIFKRCSNCLSV